MTNTKHCHATLAAAMALIWPVLAAGAVFPGAKWQVVEPASQGVNAVKLETAIEYLKAHSGRDGVRRLVIVRNGYVIWQGDQTDRVHGIWSCIKSFTSTCLGLLIDDGKCTLDTLAKDYLPAMTETYPKVTLCHFATMTSGYGFNWWCNGRHPDGKRKWPGAPDDTFAASGYNNNEMFVIPRWNMVIVRLGLDQSDHAISDEEYGHFLRMVGRSVP